VIGKFMPVHAGHMALIRFASTHCDELIVSMSYTDEDPIAHGLRFSWLQEIFKNESNIKSAMVKDDFDDESLPWPARTKVWANYLLLRYGKIDVIVSSEEYGWLLATHMKAIHISFDPDRQKVPVSATRVRLKPYHNWQFIPSVVRPYFVRKICFYGPESTGKSVMARQLAEVYHTEYVPEVAREVINSNAFTTDDIINIGYAQTKRVLEKEKVANRILFCDTDLITTQIYCQQYLGVVPEVLYELEKKILYDQYFLFDIDVPWVADGLRDLGERRDELFTVFRTELEKRNIKYKLVSGSYRQREEFLNSEIAKLLL
jgi:HTH-type transcriptional repressor of NAD biosynthesis genes